LMFRGLYQLMFRGLSVERFREKSLTGEKLLLHPDIRTPGQKESHMEAAHCLKIAVGEGGRSPMQKFKTLGQPFWEKSLWWCVNLFQCSALTFAKLNNITSGYNIIIFIWRNNCIYPPFSKVIIMTGKVTSSIFISVFIF
jgi:hypothetical protein